jgi:hypothetical protein
VGWNTGRQVRLASPGVMGDGMPTRNNEQHGKPTWLVARATGSTDAKGVWAEGVAEGLIVPGKPGNAGGGKEPWFRGADEAARGRGD